MSIASRPKTQTEKDRDFPVIKIRSGTKKRLREEAKKYYRSMCSHASYLLDESFKTG